MNARMNLNKIVSIFTAVIGRRVFARDVQNSNVKIVGSAAREKFKFINVRRKFARGYMIAMICSLIFRKNTISAPNAWSMIIGINTSMLSNLTKYLRKSGL